MEAPNAPTCRHLGQTMGWHRRRPGERLGCGILRCGSHFGALPVRTSSASHSHSRAGPPEVVRGQKRAYQGTAKQCHDANLDFVPLIFDVCSGGWDHEVQTSLSEAARAMVAKGHTLDAACGRSVHSLVAQRTCTSFRRNWRARQSGERPESHQPRTTPEQVRRKAE